MDKEKAQAYTMHISQASASRLICIAYDMWQDFYEDGIQHYEADAPDEFVSDMRKLQRVNQEIIRMMNKENPVSVRVIQIHQYVNKCIVDSILKKKPSELTRLRGLVEQLADAFKQLDEADKDEPLMQNTQQVYAGLTYGKGMLNESIDPMGQAGRGYQV